MHSLLLLSNVCYWHFHVIRSNSRMERRVMQERLQRRYRPQIPPPLAAGEVGVRDLVDVTQPPSDSLAQPTPSTQPAQGTTATRPTLTRAQQLVKKSHIVTAQQKVKVQYWYIDCFITVPVYNNMILLLFTMHYSTLRCTLTSFRVFPVATRE